MRVEEKVLRCQALEVPSGELASAKRPQSSKKNRKRTKKSGPAMSAVQRLFETCKEVFSNGRAGIVPSQADVDRLRSVLDNINASDVGLGEYMPYFDHATSQGAPAIIYLHLYECDKFSIGIWCLPSGGVIPLHNHPGMTVFSKLLFGSMHIKSYDWVNVPTKLNGVNNPSSFQRPGVLLANVNTDAIFTAPCKTSVLYPTNGGNMHCFTAKTSCAVLDVLGPPYSTPEEGRDCTYYNDFPYASFSGYEEVVKNDDRVYAWLEKRNKPDDFVVVGAKYSGPKILEP